MANVFQLPDYRHESVNVIYDRWGNRVLEIGMHEVTIYGQNQESVKQSLSENIELVCGSVYNITLSGGREPVMLLAVCDTCRHPPPRLINQETPTHGLCSRTAGHTCIDCGTFVCPRHATNSAGKQSGWRCLPCAKRARVRAVAKGCLIRFFFRGH
jgi:hypothetical protein